jgi:opacity protein-like surface antigen
LGGIEHANFSANTGHSTAISTALGLWPDSYVFAATASLPVEYNLTPNIGLRVAPEYYFTGFGSKVQSSRGFTLGIVYRFGKQ